MTEQSRVGKKIINVCQIAKKVFTYLTKVKLLYKVYQQTWESRDKLEIAFNKNYRCNTLFQGSK